MRTPTNSVTLRVRIAVLGVVASVVAAVLLPTGAAFADATDAPTPTPTATATPSAAPTTPSNPAPRHVGQHMGSYSAKAYAAQATQLPAGLGTALKRDLNVTPAQYLADAAAAAQAVKVVAALKTAGVHVLGSHIHGTALTVNVASSTDTATVTAAGATAVVGAPVVPDLSHKRFTSVSAPSGPPLAYGGQGYFLQTQAQVNQGLGNGYRCSIGFSGYNATAGSQFVTAGHCATLMDAPATPARLIDSSAPTNAGGSARITSTNLGTMVAGEAHYGDGVDYGIVGEGTSVVPQASIFTWGGGSGGPLDSAALPITGMTAAVVGANLCKSGSTTGWTCGAVLAVDYPVQVCPTGTTSCPDDTVNSIVATTCLLSGDSGGGAVIGQLAAGIDSGTDIGRTNCVNSFNTTTGEWAHYSLFFPMVSDVPALPPTTGTQSVTGQVGTNWTLLTAPVVTSPAAGATVASSISVSGTLATRPAGVQLALYLDGSTTAAATTPTFSGTTGAWSLPLTGLSNGIHSYSIGERTTSSGSTDIADVTGVFSVTSAYSIAVTSPATDGSGTVYPESFLTGTVSNAVANSTALLYLDDSPVPYAQASAASGSFAIPLTGIPTGPHTYKISAGIGAVPGALVSGSFVEGAPSAGRAAIGKLYNSLGGQSGTLGVATTQTYAVGAGFREDFAGSSIFWSAATGAILVSGGELTGYAAAGGPLGSLGWPTSGLISEPTVSGGGSGQVFQGGSIYASVAGGFAVSGVIRSSYWSLGAEAGGLGWPTGVQVAVGSGLSQPFQHGSIFWSAATGAFFSNGAELTAYNTAGGPTGSLGWPTSGVINEPAVHGGGSGQVFQGGSIYASAAGGFSVLGPIRAFYWSQGGEGGGLGWPTAAQTAITGGFSQTFQGGVIVWTASGGAHIALTPPFETAYDAAGGAPVLGNATSGVINEPTVNGGGSGQVFQGGSIYVSPAGGFAVRGAIRSAYWSLGGEGGGLAWPTGVQTIVGSGLSQTFTGGTIFYTAATGARAVYGPELTAYTAAGGPTGTVGLGWPTSGIISEPGVHGGGSGQVFQGGSIYASVSGGFAVTGAIRAFYWSQGGEGGGLSWPTSVATSTAGGGLTQSFQGGVINWSPTGGASIALTPPFQGAYDAAGGAAVLGSPTTGVINEPAVNGGGSGQVFQGGSIYVSPAGGFAVMGAIRAYYWAMGGEGGGLGWPKGPQTSVAGGLSQQFTGGAIYYSAATGPRVLQGAELTAYIAAGGPGGILGWPTSSLINEPSVSGGGSGQVFQGGSIYASVAGGFPVTGAVRAFYWAQGGEAGHLGWPTSVLDPTTHVQTFQHGQITLNGSTATSP